MENLKNINPYKVDKTTIINLEKGKLPPQALDLEEAVLGAMMIDKKGVDEVIDARVYSGIHFRTADEVGARQGRQVARFVLTHALPPCGKGGSQCL